MQMPTLSTPTAPHRTHQAIQTRHAQPGEQADTGEYLAFRLGALDYAVDIMDVQEIRSYEQPMRMVGAPACVPGVLNLRGHIVAIVDLRLRLNLPAGFDRRTVIVVMNLPTGTVGVVVDAVSDVVELSADDIQPVPTLNDSADARLFNGLVCTRQSGEERTLIVMNFQSLMPRGMATPAAPVLPL